MMKEMTMHADAMLKAKRAMNHAAEAVLRGDPGAAAIADRALDALEKAQAATLPQTASNMPAESRSDSTVTPQCFKGESLER